MTVQLEVGMTAIRRDGVRVGLVTARNSSIYEFEAGGIIYKSHGFFYLGKEYPLDIIAAGLPWATLGAQVGDTVRRVWDGGSGVVDDYSFVVRGMDKGGNTNSLYAIGKTAAKPADRPRAAHKLDLQDGGRARLDAWQDGGNFAVGTAYTFIAGKLVGDQSAGDVWDYSRNAKGNFRKGHRPLFTVISLAAEQVRGDYSLKDGKWGKHRAAEQQPDEVIVLYGCITDDEWNCTSYRFQADTHRYTIAIPHGSDIGTVLREKL